MTKLIIAFVAVVGIPSLVFTLGYLGYKDKELHVKTNIKIHDLETAVEDAHNAISERDGKIDSLEKELEDAQEAISERDGKIDSLEKDLEDALQKESNSASISSSG